MKGFVDDRNRALLPIQVASSLKAEPIEVLVWIDTAFDGHLVFSKELIRNDGRFPLLGTGLLDGRTIHISYDVKSVEVTSTNLPPISFTDIVINFHGTASSPMSILSISFRTRNPVFVTRFRIEVVSSDTLATA